MKTLKSLGTALVILVIVGVSFWYIQKDNPEIAGDYFGNNSSTDLQVEIPADFQSYERVNIEATKGKLVAFLANTPERQEQGLSNQPVLPNNASMLFTLDEPGTPGFWMKDMKFPITIVWVDQYKRVVGHTKNISPETYPDVFYPPTEVQYILEINPGVEESLGMATGTVLVF